MLAAARVKPALRRREASSRPRRWGIETMRGADILDTPANRSCGHRGSQRRTSRLGIAADKSLFGEAYATNIPGRKATKGVAFSPPLRTWGPPHRTAPFGATLARCRSSRRQIEPRRG